MSEVFLYSQMIPDELTNLSSLTELYLTPRSDDLVDRPHAMGV